MNLASFERIDYQLRYNKHIERKLVFDTFVKVVQEFPSLGHKYLGFGSIWFSDFRLAHRVLGLRDLKSMEFHDYVGRAEFNKPYRAIDVLPGNCSATLRMMPPEYWSNSIISWMDFDGCLEPQVVGDLAYLLEKCAPQSVVVITVNSSRDNYRPRVRGEEERRRRENTSVGQVEELLRASVVPQRFEPQPTEGGVLQDVTERDFPEFLAEALLLFMGHIVASSGRTTVAASGATELLQFLPLFNFAHKDGADMVTVGGAIVSGSTEPIWRERVSHGIERRAQDQLPTYQRLDMMPLTLREKVALDACLPDGMNEFVVRAQEVGLRLANGELEKYWRYYRHFPVFLESPV